MKVRSNILMMKRICILFSFLSITSTSKAQITGTDTVCAGYLYTFTATIAGADSFIWTYPNGWAEISGGTSSQVQVLCTKNVGQICVDAYDNGNHLGQYCHTVFWGGNSFGWDVQLSTLGMCQCPPNIATVVSNGTGSSCGGCGNGVVSPNLAYVIYDNPWPTGAFYSYADGVTPFQSPLFSTITCYVYLVDLTFGLSNAILIEGGLCPATINNTFTLFACQYVNLGIVANPDPVCIGDTLTLAYDDMFSNFSSMNWGNTQGDITFFGGNGWDTIQGIINSAGPVDITLNCFDSFGCPYFGSLSLNYQVCNAMITGDSIVCSGYTYNYSVNIPGAVSYNWTLPSGWYNLTGQGTTTISATCNVNDGDICVEGFDASSNSLGTQCITTEWGNGGSMGWDLWPSSFYYCAGQPRDVHWMIIPNGSGSTGCPNGCGSGTQVQNLIYGLYDTSVPYPQFIAEIDGSWIQMPPVVASYQAFYVDVTAGFNFPDAVAISGGCGSATINNTSSSNEVTPLPPTFTQFPDPACLGDTVLITQTDTYLDNTTWSVMGATLISQPDTEQIIIVPYSTIVDVYYTGFSQMYFCNVEGGYQLNICSSPVANFYAVADSLCPGTCTDFTNTSVNAQTNEWLFPGSTTPTSSDVNPSSICYSAPGSYDVTLIVTNAQGSDTLVFPNYITVFPTPQAQNIIQAGDTLISLQGYLSYQWYFNANAIAGATDYFYVALQNGDYSVVATDSNQCEVEAVITNVIASANSFSSDYFSIAPNPVKGELAVSLPAKTENIQVEIFNLLGETVFKSASKKISGKYFIDVQSLPCGIYILEAVDAQQKFRARFVKE